MGTSRARPAASIEPGARRAGFTALYDAHVAEVYRYVHRRCRDTALAEDVTQDTFLTAVRTMDNPAGVSIGWLLRVARNRLVDLLRRQDRYTQKLRVIQGGAGGEDDEELLVDRLELEAAMEQLSVEHRLVLTLHYIDGYSVPALAEELGRTVKSVEGLITRARRNLRNELRSEDD